MTAITIEAINPKILLPHATRHVCIEMMQCYRRPVRQPRAADVLIQRHAKKYHASGADLNNTPPQSGSIAGRDEWHAHRECICRAQRHCCRFPGGSLAGGAFSAAPHRQSVDSKTVVLIPQGPAMCIGVDMSGHQLHFLQKCQKSVWNQRVLWWKCFKVKVHADPLKMSLHILPSPDRRNARNGGDRLGRTGRGRWVKP